MVAGINSFTGTWIVGIYYEQHTEELIKEETITPTYMKIIIIKMIFFFLYIFWCYKMLEQSDIKTAVVPIVCEPMTHLLNQL